MTIFSDTAMRFREAGDLDQFREWAALAIEAARILTPYQSPRLTAVAIGAPAWRLVVHARDQLNGPIS